MNKLLRIPMSLVVLLFAHSVFCDTPIYQVNDAQGTFIQVPLSHNIYRYSQQPDLRNLSVLDGEQQSLPYRLVSLSPPPTKTEQQSITQSVAFFPVAVDATPDTLRKLHSTQIKTSGNTVQVATSDKTLNNNTPEFYLIDISNIDHDISSIGIDWSGAANNQYLEVELEATRNLQNWFSLAKAALVKVDSNDQQLLRNEIAVNIAKKDFEFLRLRVVRGADNLQITSVLAIQKNNVAVESVVAQESWSIAGQLAKTQTTVYLPGSHSKAYPVTAWEFVRNETTPLDSVAIDLENYSYGDSAKIFSRSAENQVWKLLYQGIWFNTQVGNEWQSTKAIDQYRNSDKYWRIELNESVQKTVSPKLVLSWQPIQLQFITNNKPPYLLAIKDNQTNSSNRDQVFNQILANTKPTWISAGLTELGIKPEAINAPKGDINWKQWIFWVALVLAVGVLLLFALRLFRQLGASNAD